MSNAYSIEGDGVTIRVRGRLNDSGSVTVEKNGAVYQFDSDQGQTDFASESVILKREDGGYIDERAISQEIHLPDGTEIERSAVTKEACLPEGRVIQGKSSDKSTIESSNESPSTNTSLSISSDSEEDEILKEARMNLISSITPGFWTMLLFAYGFVFASQGAIQVGLFIYIFLAVPAVVQYVGSLSTSSNISALGLSAGGDEESASLSFPEEQKQKLIEGEISEKEFEDRIEKHFQSKDQQSTDKNIKLESV